MNATAMKVVSGTIIFFAVALKRKRSNVRVDRAVRIHSSLAGPMTMQNAQPPLRSNDLLCRACS